MAYSWQVLEMLIPEGGYVQRGTDYEGIEFVSCKAITKEEYLAGFEKYDAWKAEQQTQLEVKKKAAEAKLAAIGLTIDDLKALGLG
jgi:hypothetical protein